MTEREKWEAGLWYYANYAPEICAEREKAEELYTAFNQTRPSEKAKRAELLHKLLPGMGEDVVILPHFYTDYGYNCSIGEGTYINHGAYLMDCAKITIGTHCFIGPNCGMYTAIHPLLQFVPVGFGLAAVLTLLTSFVTHQDRLVGLAVVFGFLAGVAFLLVPLLAMLAGARAENSSSRR